MTTKVTNLEMLEIMISTNLYVDIERGRIFAEDEIIAHGMRLRHALDQLYPVSNRDWVDLLKKIIANFAMMKIEENPKVETPIETEIPRIETPPKIETPFMNQYEKIRARIENTST